MPCNPLPSSKDMQDPKEWDTENREMQCKLCFQRVDQISSNGLKLQAWMFLAEPAFLRLIPAPGWNKAVSVTGISLSWFSHLNFKAHCRWLFFSFFSDKTVPELPGDYFTEGYWPEECCLDIQGAEESPSKAEGTPLSCDVGQSLAQRLMLWAEPGCCEGAGSSCVWVSLYHSPDCCSTEAFFFISCFFSFVHS